MKTNYENWMPKSIVNYLKYGSLVSGAIFVTLTIYIITRKVLGTHYIPWISIVASLFLILSAVLFIFYKKFEYMRKQFDYENSDAISWKIINYTANNMKLDSGKILDVGCGSGALAIAVAKNNPNCEVVGMDRWGIDYKEFSKKLCENNAKAEGVTNTSFVNGNAVKLDFKDESFDGVVSNYVYHNIAGNRQNYLLETFRVLKKGGRFAIHDLFTKGKYGDMDKFIDKLKHMGFEKVELIDTTSGNPMTLTEAKATMLTGSKLLVGVK